MLSELFGALSVHRREHVPIRRSRPVNHRISSIAVRVEQKQKAHRFSSSSSSSSSSIFSSSSTFFFIFFFFFFFFSRVSISSPRNKNECYENKNERRRALKKRNRSPLLRHQTFFLQPYRLFLLVFRFFRTWLDFIRFHLISRVIDGVVNVFLKLFWVFLLVFHCSDYFLTENEPVAVKSGQTWP